MMNKSAEKTISLFLLVGVPFTTIFLLTSTVSDPVNVTKLFAAGSLSFSIFAIAMIFLAKEVWKRARVLVVASILFILFSINAIIASDSPLSQNLYGVFGRQTGFVAYLSLTMATLATVILTARKSFDRLVVALLVAGTINVLYCGWALVFGDFVGWNNPYGKILGTFGNPDFISAFLGMFIAGTLAYAFSSKHSWWYKAGFIALSVVALVEIKKSHAIQGLVVTATGIAIIGFYFVRAKTKGNALTFTYILGVGVVGAFALAGALQKGPLASIIYKVSVSLRGQYWKAGIEMGTSHPFTGVGMDSYGDWYRRTRTEYAATVLPGPKVITNVAHNVVIDFFAYGGYPLLIAYLAMLGIGIWAIIRVTLRNRAYDGTFVAIAVTWVTYQLQSIISINQVGLAIWGWVLLGALVAYEYTTRPGNEVKEKAPLKKADPIFSPQLVGGLGLLVGALVAVPPLAADMKWQSAVISKDAQKVEAALTGGYLAPQDSSRLAQAVILFANSNLPDQAHRVALMGVKFNPEYMDAWRVLYSLSNATQAEKDEALKNMKRLDPLNPDVLAQ